jgi:MotA/TolQ/ExbB proton channel family
VIELSKIATHLLVTGGLLSLLVLAFLAMFLVPGAVHWMRLRKILAGVESFKTKTPPGEFKKLFARDKHMAHLWAEYQESLHVQREERDGQMQVVAVRSTVAAETYFNGQFVVDSRLRTEFFKHLPGIFTGLGIIGTFTGLIEGLRSFQVSDNAATVRASLESLMHAVGEAFLISAAAITAAMAVTFFEKLVQVKSTCPGWSTHLKPRPVSRRFSRMPWSRNSVTSCGNSPPRSFPPDST